MLKMIRILLRIFLGIIGGFSLLWSFFCIMGGPDGRTGSSDSIKFGMVFLILGLTSIISIWGIGKIKFLNKK